jgi:transposase
MRVSTAFNRLLQIEGASVVAVRFEREGLVVSLRRRARRLVCPRCGCLGRAGDDRRERRRWRHLDLGATRCYLECELRRFACPGCERVVTEAVAWARAGARFSRDFEDVVCWLAQQAAFSVISRLLRVTWRSVAAIVSRVVGGELARQRLCGLELIGVDELSYRRGQRYLTLVADHADGAVVCADKGRGAATLERFFDQLGEQETAKLRAVSIDMSGGYQKAIRARAAHVTVCFDPFHVVALANRALDELRRALWNRLGKSKGSGKVIKGTRWALLNDPSALTDSQQGTLALLEKLNSPLYRGYPLKEQLRALYHPDSRPYAPALLDAWLSAAARSKLKPFVKLARTLREHQDGILNAIRLGLTNSRLEGLASRIRLISHRSFGFHTAEPLIALIHLCCRRISVQLPTRMAEDPEMSAGSGGGGFEGDAVSEPFELGDESAGGAFGVLAVEVVAAEFTVELAGLEHVPAGADDRVFDSAERAPVAAAGP